MAAITLKGSVTNTCGDLPPVGRAAPDFVLVNGKLSDVNLASYTGKRKLLNIVPSLDTSTCAISTRKFNKKAALLKNTVVLVISADLPFAQVRFCQTEGIKNIVPLSTMRSGKFAEDYGVLIVDGRLRGLTCRAVVVMAENDVVMYTQLVSEIADEPDYDKALAALA